MNNNCIFFLTFLSCLLCLKVCLSQVNLSLGLVGHWDFNGNANDISGNGNNGTLFGVVPTSGVNGTVNSAYFFNGNSSYIEVPNSPSVNFPSDSFSLYVILKPQGYYYGACHGNAIIDKGNSDGIAGFYGLRFDDGPFTNWLNCSNSTVDTSHQNFYITRQNVSLGSIASAPYIVSNYWYCLIAVCDGNTLKTYVNGVLRSNTIVNGQAGINSHNLFIGRKNSNQYPYWFTGVMDEIRIYNRPLNTQEIDSLCFDVTNPNTISANFNHSAISACGQATVQFTDLSTATNATVYAWNWNFGDGNTSTAQNPTHTYTNSGTYNVTLIATNSMGKSDTITQPINVTIFPLPTININPTSPTVCSGNPCTLTASGSATSYTWSGGITNGVSFFPASTTTYTVTAIDANGCSNTASVMVTVVNNLNILVNPANPTLCLGDSVLLTASGATDYQWSSQPGLNTYSGNVVWANPSTNTQYTITGSDGSGCTGTTIASIEVIPNITVSATKNRDAECNINTVQLQASGAQQYAWTPASLVSNPNAAYTNATVSQTTTFYVIGSTGTCSDMDSITVYYYNNELDKMYIPNAFSPNGDGNNDCFTILHQANFKKYYIGIYNRWGERVFESNNTNDCWNGYFKNQLAPLDTYYFFIDAESTCGKLFYKGDVLLVK